MVDLKRKIQRENLKANGLCVSNHSKQAVPGYVLCRECLDLRKNYRNKRRESNLCTDCGNSLIISKQKSRCDDCRDKYLANKYGLTVEEYRALPKRCAICNESADLVVDHCHETLRVRGVLCRICNSVLGLIEENIGRARAIASYLEKYS